MKAILEFTLPEDETDLNYAKNGARYRILIGKLLDRCRNVLKYDNNFIHENNKPTEDIYKCYEDIRDFIINSANEDNLPLD